ncbi:Metal-binding regulatory protein cuf1 [Schizosaccharomyces pombe]|uniref:Metal-binding regulatory protein cuf1 n=1 Tax=Schizosaccharomyces pombe (strain 972 / ATCC 24843) TaxID=284812 RepID=CUF1_SCHPO|nr:Cu-sensing transcription factor Cuf1 [Schizosaccharomyces pombe]Q09728.1 RecName: Full=Metal-binding regulatory protein cuf1 [Schizosaccharomyces pombe 972h-]AAD51063.1 Cuf1 protein [Schizosaccharomyces pombe]CAA90469.1 nutritional copper sensing transcription factor Cuf1 [Schizosaccharomyces pombe]CAB52304.1 copper-sensing transcription factor [Schizosaccharomyces pombe]|eukprot:NP_592923.1 Cu-sensing transcription factor Cuf1 [Schizosaccharomyces pombe]
MVVINNVKMACMKCIRGHRSSTCKHNDRELFPIRPKGRPISQCEKCRIARITRHLHVKCTCNSRKKGSKCSTSSTTDLDSSSASNSSCSIPSSISEKLLPRDNVKTHCPKRSASCCGKKPDVMPLKINLESQTDFMGMPLQSQRPHSESYRMLPEPEKFKSEYGYPSQFLPIEKLTSNVAYPPNYNNYLKSPYQQPTNFPPEIQYNYSHSPQHSIQEAEEAAVYGPPVYRSGYQILYNNNTDSIAAAAATHDLYPQPDVPLTFAMLADGNYVPLPSSTNTYGPSNSYGYEININESTNHVDSSYLPHPIQLSNYFTLPSSCAQADAACQCGDNCECLGCLTHPNNATTLAALNHISALEKETISHTDLHHTFKHEVNSSNNYELTNDELAASSPLYTSSSVPPSHITTGST